MVVDVIYCYTLAVWEAAAKSYRAKRMNPATIVYDIYCTVYLKKKKKKKKNL
jgi:hypothetical protein